MKDTQGSSALLTALIQDTNYYFSNVNILQLYLFIHL